MFFSVLMSVYINENPQYLDECLDSINQQVLRASEVVLVQDGLLSSELYNVIDKWRKRLNIIDVILPENVGLADALNCGLKYCNYDLVARMDTDDIATPERFKLQFEFMEQNPNIAVSSGYIEEWNSDFSSKISQRTLPLHHDEIVKFAKIRSPISHPACIFRKSVIQRVGGYEKIYPEDHLLWTRVLQSGYKMANLPKVLLLMRTGDDFISRRGYTFLRGELISYRKMYQSRFLTLSEFIKASTLRSLVRLSPKFLKLWLYKRLR